MVIIETYAGDGTTGTKIFSSIPGTYNDLILSISGRSSLAAIYEGLSITLNGVGGTSYDRQRMTATTTSRSTDESIGAASWNACLGLPGASVGNLTFVGGGELEILDYAHTTLYKTMNGQGWRPEVTTTGRGLLTFFSGQFRSTSAVTSLTIALNSGGNFESGTTINLYGRS